MQTSRTYKRKPRSLWGDIVAYMITAGVGVLLVLGAIYAFRWIVVNAQLFWLCTLFTLPVLGGILIFLYLKNRLFTMGSGSIICTMILIIGVMNAIAQYLW